jgi:hypothetical protein
MVNEIKHNCADEDQQKFTALRIFLRKRPLGRPIRRWEDNIKIYFRELG